MGVTTYWKEREHALGLGSRTVHTRMTNLTTFRKLIFDIGEFIGDPRYATSIGLIKYAGEHLEDYKEIDNKSIFEAFKSFLKKIINNK